MTNYQLKDLSDLGNSLAYYVDTTGPTKLEYFCMPGQPDQLVTTPGWKIMRIEKSKTTDEFIPGKCIRYVNGSPSYEYLATSLATVQSYSYI